MLEQMVERNEPLYPVVLSDFSMPELDGPQVTKRIRSIYKKAGV